jgi:hypothetical protein
VSVKKTIGGAVVRLAEALGLLDPLEASQAELEALELQPQRPPEKKTKKSKRDAGKPRDELGRFAKRMKK